MMIRLQQSGAVEVAKMQAREYVGRARSAIVDLPETPAKMELQRLTDMVLERNK
jgi:geranylgeranyl pyrophosphate synthase